MKKLIDYKDSIRKCSKCGLCQAVCPLYKITGSDCTVSRGQFIMLKGVLDGKIKLNDKVNRYLDLCLKCGACSKFCPSGIDVVDVISAAKYEYFKTHKSERINSFLKKHLIFGLLTGIAGLFHKKSKSKNFQKKVLYFGGCGSKITGTDSIVKLLNKMNIEVITPNFSCCGIWAYTSGDLDTFNKYIDSFISEVKKYDIKEIVTSCASCEKALKDYIRHTEDDAKKEILSELNIKSIYSYISENKLTIKLKKSITATYHKPCNTFDFESIEYVLNNTENLNYIKMEDYNTCCGLNILSDLKEYKIASKIFTNKRKCIEKSGVNIVLTTCLGCVATLKINSKGKYKVFDLLEFLAKNVE